MQLKKQDFFRARIRLQRLATVGEAGEAKFEAQS